MEAVLTCLGVPGRPLGNPPVVVFNLRRGGVPRGRPVAGQLSGTPMRAGPRGRPVAGQLSCTILRTGTHLTLCVPVLGSRVLSPSRSPALQLGPRLRRLTRPNSYISFILISNKQS
jgi:hypothetical protein